jgi:glycerophosphoryl diester phosphodiesterase
MATNLMVPSVIGHRGAAAHAPENTRRGFRIARALGCRWVEFDVRLAADGGLVVLHDATLDRTTNGSGRVIDHTVAELAALDAGDGGGVPTLTESLDLLAELGLGANVEVKAESVETATMTGALTALACQDARKRHGLDLLISSFVPAALAAARGAAAEVPRGLLRDRPGRDWRAAAADFGCISLHVQERCATAALARAVHGAGLRLLAYTVNDPARAAALFAAGVDGLFSDAPDRILAVARPEPAPPPA